MEEKIYRVSKNLYNLEIQEIEIESKTESFYKAKGSTRREAIDTTYYRCFSSKRQAYEYLRGSLSSKIESLQSSAEYYREKLMRLINDHA